MKMLLAIKRPNIKTYLFILVLFSLLPAIYLLLTVFGIVFTYTGSVPIGFYRIASKNMPIHRGDYISFCLPTQIAKMGLLRGYLHHGACANGSERLMKQVIAVPHDIVTVMSETMTVNHDTETFHYVAPREMIDSTHQPVHHFINTGRYKLSGYWVYGNGNTHYSWDSRYYGAIDKSYIIHRVLPLLQF